MLLRIDNGVYINTDKIICINVSYEHDEFTDNAINISSVMIIMQDHKDYDTSYCFQHNHALRVLYLLELSGYSNAIED